MTNSQKQKQQNIPLHKYPDSALIKELAQLLPPVGYAVSSKKYQRIPDSLASLTTAEKYATDAGILSEFAAQIAAVKE